jgi:hypothetical protein
VLGHFSGINFLFLSSSSFSIYVGSGFGRLSWVLGLLVFFFGRGVRIFWWVFGGLLGWGAFGAGLGVRRELLLFFEIWVLLGSGWC